MFRFETHRYSSIKKFAYIKVFDGDRLVAIVRQPPSTIPMIDGLKGERADHWRVDCDQSEFDPVLNAELKVEVARYLGTDKVSVFPSTTWSWRDQGNTEPFEPAVGEPKHLRLPEA
jgi:hypothetical protein